MLIITMKPAISLQVGDIVFLGDTRGEEYDDVEAAPQVAIVGIEDIGNFIHIETQDGYAEVPRNASVPTLNTSMKVTLCGSGGRTIKFILWKQN